MRWASLGAAVILYAAMASAQPVLDNPGYCGLGSGEQELADVGWLTATDLGNHGIGCDWDDPIRIGAAASRDARCSDGAESWPARIVFEALGRRPGLAGP